MSLDSRLSHSTYTSLLKSQSNMRKSAGNHAQFREASDRSLLVSFGERITLETHQDVRKLLRLLQIEPMDGIRNLHPAYCSLLIQFDALQLDHDELQSRLTSYLVRLEEAPLPGAARN